MSHTGGRGVDPEIVSSNVERCRVCVGPTQNWGYENMSYRSETENVPGGRRF